VADYDAIVIGLGGVGSAAAFHLARRGLKVLGLEQHAAGHRLGSSHGETRVIRKAYFEHPNYVPLLQRAYELWDELAANSGKELFQRSGVLLVGRPDGEVISGSLQSARDHEIEVEALPAEQARQRFPGFRIPDDQVALLEPDAGFLRVERCVLAHWEAARAAGADLREHAAVQRLEFRPGEVLVTVDGQTYSGGGAILSSGAWTSHVWPDCPVRLEVRRKVSGWFPLSEASEQDWRRAPAFLFEQPEGIFYGLPSQDGQTVKVAEHTGGRVVANPDQEDRSVSPEELDSVGQFVSRSLPDIGISPERSSCCFYTMSPDQHFCIGRIANFEHVIAVAGLSGHGFKFTSVLGEIGSELLIDGEAKLPAAFLKWNRFGMI
jgi:sarcosine oxidase